MHRVWKISCRAGSSLPMMNSADLTTLRKTLRSLAVQLPTHTVMQPVSMLSLVHMSKVVRMTDSIPNFFSLLRKKRRFRGRFHHLVRVNRPGEITADVHPEE